MAQTTAKKDMRAWTYSSTGIPSSVLTLNKSIEIPKLMSPTSVLVAVSHTALNPSDQVVMQTVPSLVRSSPPWIPGLDFSGTIVAIGTAVESQRAEFKVGVEVFGTVPLSIHIRAGVGALAEFTIADISTIALKPAHVPFSAVGGLCIVGTSALMLVEKAGLKKSDKVFVYGGNGGVGSITVQLVKRAIGEEGKVVAACSESNVDFVKNLGADEVINYQAHDSLSSYLSQTYSKDPFDSVIDTVGIQDLYTYCESYLTTNGSFVSVGVKLTPLNLSNLARAGAMMAKNTALPKFLGGVARSYVAISATAPSRPHLDELGSLVGSGELKTFVDSEWVMEDALKAYDRSMARGLRGKVIIKVAFSMESEP